jgi:GNAT superfamily N-acetyltransferase
MTRDKLTVRALTTENWNDFEAVMGKNGGSRGCWCMHWRLSIARFMDQKGEGNRRAMRRLAKNSAPPPGLIGYLAGEPIAWCSLGPRAAYPRLERSPVVKAVEDDGACAITCLFVQREQRSNGLLAALIEATCSYAAKNGYELIEGYPIEPKRGKQAGSDTAMTGIASAFRDAGFDEVARPRKDRPIMRKQL